MNETQNYILFMRQLESLEDWYKTQIEQAHIDHKPDFEDYFQSKLDMIQDIQTIAKICFS